MKKSRWLDRTILESSHFYTLCTNERQFHQVLKHLRLKKALWPGFLSSDYASATVHFLENLSGGKCAAVVCLGDVEGKSSSQVLALLAHEAVHIWQEVKNNIGERSPGTEIEAYAIQSIAQALFIEYERQTA